MPKSTRLNKKEAAILVLIDDFVTDTYRLAAEADIKAKELEILLKKLEKLKLVSLVKKRKEIIEAKVTEKGKTYIQKHRKSSFC